MLSEEMIRKMKKYNRLRSQADNLQHEIEKYLDDNYGISTLTANDTYGMDGNCPMYEWGTPYFNIEQIEDIISFKDDYRNEVGESPCDFEISEHFKR